VGVSYGKADLARTHPHRLKPAPLKPAPLASQDGLLARKNQSSELLKLLCWQDRNTIPLPPREID
jgi:hypothetical protein